MGAELVVDVKSLLGHPEVEQEFAGVVPVSLRLGETTVKGSMEADGILRGTVDGVIADFAVRAPAHFVCARCLTEWDGEIEAQGFQTMTRAPDEDGYAIEDGHVDLAGPVTDELALAIPPVPLCKKDCKGLCPTCGTDLNSDPCDGHGEESDSPFAVLKDLLDS